MTRFIKGKYEGYDAQIDAWYSYVRVCGWVLGVAVPGVLVQLTIWTKEGNALCRFRLRLNGSLTLRSYRR